MTINTFTRLGVIPDSWYFGEVEDAMFTGDSSREDIMSIAMAANPVLVLKLHKTHLHTLLENTF